MEAEEVELGEAIEKIKTQIETVSVDYANYQNELQLLEQEKRGLEKKKSDFMDEFSQEEKK